MAQHIQNPYNYNHSETELIEFLEMFHLIITELGKEKVQDILTSSQTNK